MSPQSIYDPVCVVHARSQLTDHLPPIVRELPGHRRSSFRYRCCFGYAREFRAADEVFELRKLAEDPGRSPEDPAAHGFDGHCQYQINRNIKPMRDGDFRL